MRGKSKTPWPPEHLQYLRRLVEKGLGDTAIAHALNAYYGTARTRDAIIGKRHREKIAAPEGRERASRQDGKRVLPRGHQPPPPARPRIRAVPAKPVEAPKPAKVAKPAAPKPIKSPALRKLPFRPPQREMPMSLSGPHVAGIPLMPRQRHQCGWPINDGDPFLFCGAPKAEFDRTYCPYHRWLATPPSARHRLGAGTP